MALVCYLVSDERTEVAYVLVLGVPEVLLHQLVDGINATLQRLKQTATTYDSVKLQGNASLLKKVEHEVFAIFILLVDGRELIYFCWVM